MCNVIHYIGMHTLLYFRITLTNPSSSSLLYTQCLTSFPFCAIYLIMTATTLPPAYWCLPCSKIVKPVYGEFLHPSDKITRSCLVCSTCGSMVSPMEEKK